MSLARAHSDEEMFKAINRTLQSDLKHFIRYSFSYLRPGEEYTHSWHIDAISAYLQAVKNGEIKRLIINMPPRMMKSLTTSVAFPAWLIGNNPTTSVICASYAQTLSNQHSLDCRAIMESEWYMSAFPDCRLAKDQNEKSKYKTTMNGMRFATSVGGTLTGAGGSFIIVDDPLDPNRAASDVEREKANNWMSSTVPSRLNNPEKDAIIVVMQRLHEEDVTGFLLDKGGWDHLSLPAQNDRKRIIEIGKFKKVFHDGELLSPDRLPQKILDDLEHDLGSYAYAGQYLQSPVPKGGGILQASWWREWITKALPPCDYILQVYDTAFKVGSQNDYSARTTWGIFLYNNRPNIILLEAMNLRLTLPDLKAEAIESYNEYDPDIVLIEDKASGISLIQELKRTGMRIKALKRGAGDDKVSRAHIASVMLEQGVVWYPKDYKWVNEVIRQCASFPNAKHDDLVDTVTDALIFLRHYKKLEVKDDHAVSQGSSSFKPNYGGHYG